MAGQLAEDEMSEDECLRIKWLDNWLGQLVGILVINQVNCLGQLLHRLAG